MISISRFQKIVWDYYAQHGRHDMAWRKTRDPYKILVSEIMLQQTQVSRVTEKYREFTKALPTFAALASAPTAHVLKLWQGLGYNRRALYLHKLAKIVMMNYKGKLPKDKEALVALPGIGPNTAGAIQAYAYNLPTVFIETNIRRIFIHHFFPKRMKVSDTELLPLVEKSLPKGRSREWYWALMDYGTHLKTQVENPNKRSKHYAVQSTFLGSDREVRGKIVKLLLAEQKITKKKLIVKLGEPAERVEKILAGLVKEGFVKGSGVQVYTI